MKSDISCEWKLLSLKLLKDCIEVNIQVPSVLAVSKLIKLITIFAKHNAGNSDDNRGNDIFPDDNDG